VRHEDGARTLLTVFGRQQKRAVAFDDPAVAATVEIGTRGLDAVTRRIQVSGYRIRMIVKPVVTLRGAMALGPLVIFRRRTQEVPQVQRTAQTTPPPDNSTTRFTGA
jgi:hypothetical protein